MEITCKIIGDLLPLYAENLTSEDSNAAIEAHLAHCEKCRHALDGLQKPSGVVPAASGSLKKVSSEIRRRRRLTAAFCVLLTAALLLGVFTWLYQPVYLSTWEAVSHVTAKDNVVTVHFTPQTERCRFTEETNPDTGKKSVTLIACKRTWDLYRDETGTRSPMVFENVSEVWYASTDNAQEDTLLWGVPTSGGRVSLPWLGMRFYLLLAVVFGSLFFVLWLFLRKRKSGTVLGIVSTFCLCYAFSAWFTTGGSMLIYVPQDKPIIFGITALLAALVTGAAFCGRELCLAKREDKAA